MISERKKTVAVIGPTTESASGVCPKLGLMDGKATIPHDFDETLEEFENDYYSE